MGDGIRALARNKKPTSTFVMMGLMQLALMRSGNLHVIH